MERPRLGQSIGIGLLFAASAMFGERKIRRDSSGGITPPAAAAIASTSASTSSAASHLDGASLLSAYYQQDIAAIDPEVRRHVLRAFILTLPDPVSSHLDWSYDAELESVRRAMEHSGYVIDRFWLPWRSTGDTTTGRVGVADSLPGVRWPGVMLFRRGDTSDSSLVLIYVVGEVPTSGIHRLAMREALDERRRLLPVDGAHPIIDTVRVIGPAFSGSSVSLRRALSLWRGSITDAPLIEIVSGSASDATNLTTLSDRALGMHFRATVHTSGWLAATALRLVSQQLHILPSEVAFLHEGTTQFGNSAARDTTSVRAAAASEGDSKVAAAEDDPATGWMTAFVRTLHLRFERGRAPPNTRKAPGTSIGDTSVTLPLEIAFPMSISELRVQYARHPDRVVQPTREGAAPEGPRLALDQREPASLSESPGFLSQLTAPSTELLLGQIERSLLAHHIRAVGILATDVRDELFLADEIRKRLPDVQLFFYGSNVLLLRPDYQKALRGSLVVSTYPLVMENQFWDLTKNDRARLIFMSDESEGVFNATLYQLGKRADMMEYASPMASVNSYGPPTWLTVVGRDAMYPVALVDRPISTDARKETRYLATRFAEPFHRATEANARPGQFMLTLFLMLAGFIASFVLLQRRTSRRVGALAVFPTDMPGESEDGVLQNPSERQRTMRRASLLLHREMYVLLRKFSLFTGFACAVLLLLRPQAHGVPTARWVLVILGTVALLLTLVVFRRALVQSRDVMTIGKQHDIRLPFAGFFARKRDRLLSGVEWVARLLVFLLGVLYFGISLIFLWNVIALDPAKSALFFQRAVAVTSGVSPVAPLILAGVGFTAWCTWHLTRIALLAEPTVFEEFLLRQADDEAARRTAIQQVRSMEQNASLRARNAHEWSRYAIKEHHNRLAKKGAPRATALTGVTSLTDDRPQGTIAPPGGMRRTMVSPDELLQRAGAEADRAWLDCRTAEEVMRRVLDATPSARWPSRDVLSEETGEVARSAMRARMYFDRAWRILASTDSDTYAIPTHTSSVIADTRSRPTLHALRTTMGVWKGGAETWITDMVERSARRAPTLVRVKRRTMLGVGALTDWYERASHDFRTVQRTPSAAQALADALFYLIPNGVALIVLIAMIGFAVWLALQFELSLESLVISPLPGLTHATSFDVLFRFAVLALTGLTAWAVYRLAVVWVGIRCILDEFPPDLAPSFEELPGKLARLTHLTFFGHASAAEIEEVVDEQVKKMKDAYADAEPDLTDALRKELGPEPRVMAPTPRARPYRLELTSYEDFARLHETLEICRKHHLLDQGAPHSGNASTKYAQTSANAQRNGMGQASTRPTSADPGAAKREAWARSVANLYVVFVADYVDWVLQHMRYLASFLLVCLLVVVVLLSSYPFQPQSALRVIHTIILVVAVATLVLVIVQMNRQRVLSAIANTTPGEVSWDTRFVSTLVTYGALPLLTLISTEFPTVRDFLFSWVEPLMRTFAKG